MSCNICPVIPKNKWGQIFRTWAKKINVYLLPSNLLYALVWHSECAQAAALDAAQFAKQIVPIGLIRASLPHASEAQRDQMRAILVQL